MELFRAETELVLWVQTVILERMLLNQETLHILHQVDASILRTDIIVTTKMMHSILT